MAYQFGRAALIALASTASAAASYLDTCDAGAIHTRLDPGYYKTCGTLLFNIFTMLDAKREFPSLIEQSAAAREVYESIQVAHRLEVGQRVYYPQLSALLQKISA